MDFIRMLKSERNDLPTGVPEQNNDPVNIKVS